MINSKKQHGFTIIELTLAMAFIAFMLLFMVGAILQVTRMYVKGSAIRQINQTGRQVIEDMTDSLRKGSNPVYVAGHNRLCAGGTSYVWNVGDTVTNRFDGESSSSKLRFISAQDTEGGLCNSPYTTIAKAGSTDLVGPDITVLRFSVSQQGSTPLYTVSLVLSTAGSNVASGGQSTPTGFACAADNQFCAFGDFTATAYARGGQAL